MIRLLSVIVFLALIVSPSAAAKRVALVIGISSYQHVPELANPSNDAADMSSRLKGLGFTVIEGRDLTLAGMHGKVREFIGTLADADIGLFYYAGHGLQVNGKNYLAPVDAQLITYDDLDFEALPIGMILSAMERKTKTNLVFLDACRNNPLARNLARSMGTRSTDVGRGLARISSGVGTLISFSTQPGNIALDGTGRNSPFTAALVKHLGAPGEDITRSLRRVRNEVLAATDGKQVPWENSSLTGDVVLQEAELSQQETAKEDEATAALRKQLADMQEQLKQAQEKLSSPPQENASGQADVETAALSRTERQSPLPAGNTPAAIESTAAARNYARAQKNNTERAWQLFIRKHGGDRLYGPLALQQLGLASATGSPDARNREVENYLGLGQTEKSKIQAVLNSKGFVAGDADGVFGPKTRSAIREYQLSSGVSGTGYVDDNLLALLGIDTQGGDVGEFVSGGIARIFDPDDLAALGEKKVIVDAIACLGPFSTVVYAQRGDKIYLAVSASQTEVSKQQKRQRSAAVAW